MKFWITLGIIGLLCAALLFDGARMYWLKSAALNVPAGYALGPEDADLTVYAFIDYSCPECRTIEPILELAAQQDGRVKIVPLPLYPPGDAEGERAARMVYAAGRQGRFADAHKILISDYRALGEGFVSELAARIGADTAQLEADFNDPAITKTPERNLKALSAMKSEVTPTLLIGNRLMFRPFEGMPDVEMMRALFEQGRQYQ